MPATAIYPRKFKSVLNALNMPDLADFMTADEAAEILGFHIETIRRLLRDGELKGERWARRWLVKRDSVAEYKQRYTLSKNKFDPHAHQINE